jgi:crotonobetainyl-CoA:carnitine CoA-transferase CaiB-like acyl-CoA transferase
MKNIFSDLKVVELASVLAGPAVGMFFAELGADVVKIENTNGGDLTRKWKQKEEDPDAPASSYYYSVNWNKKVLFRDLRQQQDFDEVLEFISMADVLITNFKHGDDIKFGLTKDFLRARFPKLIIGDIKGFEDSGRVAYDAVLQAETGFMSMNGTIPSGPLKMPVALIDILAAHQLKEGILIALINKLKTNVGAYVQVTLFGAAVASLANQASNYLNQHTIPKREGSLHPNIAPYGEIIKTGSGDEIILAVGTDPQFKNLCFALKVDKLSDDSRFSSNSFRILNREMLLELLNKSSINFDTQELLSAFEHLQVPAGLIRNLKQVFEEPSAQKLILEQEELDGSISKRVSTVAFKIEF